MYGVILGTAAMWCWEYLDIPAVFAYLNAATEYAVKSTAGYN